MEGKMREVKLRKIWKLIEDVKEGNVSEEELNRLYEERLAKDADVRYFPLLQSLF